MSNILQIVENEQTSEFYPTPKAIVDKMLSGIDWHFVKTILEPSAGKGDILRELTLNEDLIHGYGFDIDCIEIDPNLRQILKYNFGQRKRDLQNESKSIRDKYKYCEHRYQKGWCFYNESTRDYEPIPNNDSRRLDEIEKEIRHFFKNGIHIVHDNFLTYNPFKEYDLIIMNPPFSDGDKHLLKALKIQEKGGSIICLLNAETIRNPYTETRKELIRQLNKHNAQIEYIENGFVSAERKTGVEIALIKVCIEQVQEESDIYNRLKEAEQIEEIDVSVTDIAITDFIKSIIAQYNVEVKAGLELIRQYRALKPYMLRSFDTKEVKHPDGSVTTEYSDTSSILRLTNSYERSYSDISVNDYLKDVRLKYWKTLLSNPKFTGKLTSKLREDYWKKVDSLSDYDFTEFNIYTLSAEMNANIRRGIEEEIIVMFDRLTAEHSWYPECSKNRHYYDGWQTNKAHKIDKKVIIPCHGVYDSWDGKPRTYNAYNSLADIERILNFLDGKMTKDVDSEAEIKEHFRVGETKNIPLKYFKATFYKKGTVHLTFTCPELIERFNIYAAQRKGWLPPNYGKVVYNLLTVEEKAVVDSFQGEEAYNEVMAKSDYYLAPVTNNQMLMLGGN